MFSKKFVIEKLSHIIEEVSNKPIFIEGVTGNEKKQHVNVKVAIPEEMSSDAKQQIETEIIQALKKVANICRA